MALTEIVARIAKRDRLRPEADLQADIRGLLLEPELALGDDDRARVEVQTGDGTRRRIDIVAGATVIEVKRDLTVAGVEREAVLQLGGYVEQQTQRWGTRYTGILTDGATWKLYNLDPVSNVLNEASILTVDSADDSNRLVNWLQSVLATATNVRPLPAQIESRLGVESPAYAQDHQYLMGLFRSLEDHPEVVLKRQLWARLLRSALGTRFNDDPTLFVDHTLLVLQANVIAHAVIGLSLSTLAAHPAILLSGEEFRNSDINNVVEADFFDWILQAPQGGEFVATIVRRVGVFDWSAIEHDVLKVLYESVIAAETRKSLGEYYTPDWLADGMVRKAITKPLQQRVLDPACGSGTFLFQAVRQHLAAASAQGLNNAEAIESVTEHVFGLDIHPVSVVLARVTYLLAIGLDRISGERGAVTIPVYLGDSMQWSNDSTSDVDTMTVPVDASDLAAQRHQPALFDTGRVLAFPLSTVDDPATFDRLISELAAAAQTYTRPGAPLPPASHILNQFGLTDGRDRAILTSTFHLLCTLNADKENHIWGYFVRNQVRPLWLALPGREIDVLIGNPPWVAYRFMTEDMQKQFKRFSETKNLWAGTKVATNQDLVGLFIARCVEQYLKLGGTFAFVTPLAILSRMHGEGFRAGSWGGAFRLGARIPTQNRMTSVNVTFTEPWNLDEVRPNNFFPVPSGVVFGTRTATAGPMPRSETRWVGQRPRSGGWEEARQHLNPTSTNSVHVTVDGGGRVSGYDKVTFQGATIVPKVLFFVQPARSSPLGVRAGASAVTSSRSTLEKPPWRDLPPLTGTVEDRFLARVHLGATIVPFRALTPVTAVLPVDGVTLLDRDRIRNSHGLNEWWTRAEQIWNLNKTLKNKMTLMEQLDYQGKMKKQLGRGRHRVVYTASGTRLTAARIDSPAVIEHSLYWLAASSTSEARYLTAILNSAATTLAVSVLQSRGLFGARHFDKYVWYLPIPLFDDQNELHLTLADLARQAEEIAALVDIPDTQAFTTTRANVRAALSQSGVAEQIELIVDTMMNPITQRGA